MEKTGLSDEHLLHDPGDLVASYPSLHVHSFVPVVGQVEFVTHLSVWDAQLFPALISENMNPGGRVNYCHNHNTRPLNILGLCKHTCMHFITS